MTMKRLICRVFGVLAVAVSLSVPATAQLTIVNNGKAASRIVVAAPATPADSRAGLLLQDFVERITGARLAVVEADTKTRRGDIVIATHTGEGIGDDGFRIDCNANGLRITGGGRKGSVYGVVTLLEQYMGVLYLAKDAYTLTPARTVTLPLINRTERPAFRYRQTQSYGTQDSVYYDWFRLNEPREMFIDNMWVHTFNRILPASRFGKEHPEYYAFVNGERRPGSNSQWCLTNPDVFDAAVRQLDSIFRAHPDMKMISVSQNDGNDTYCACPECRAVDEYEGSPSGNFIRFVNHLAERFPDKEFSTLAYLFTMRPPKHVRPLPNVNIMLCDIDCKRELPLTDTPSGQDFVKALEGWSKISNNIFVWDYGINFDNTVSPFPNFHVLQKNIQLFHKHHVNMHFSQVNGIRGGDFSELRAFMLSKLMWNPYQNADSLMTTFMRGYYGAAAPYLYQYQKIMQGALIASHTPLWIYDSPISHKDGMLCPALIKTYNELFDQAEASVSGDQTLLDRVRLSRLTLQYSELEIARTQPDADKQATLQLLQTFSERTRKYGVQTLNERNNPPAEYCELYKTRYLPQSEVSLAHGCPVTWLLPPAQSYRRIADHALTDGLYGGTTFVESWVGWEGVDGAFVIDLGKEQPVKRIEADFLHQLGAWILLPKSVSYSVSSDGTNYQSFGQKICFGEDREAKVKFVKATATGEATARYVKVEIGTIGLCPTWHYGVGHPAWFFLDEVSVY